MKIKEERWNRAEVWDNYKAGIMDTETGEIIVPVRYDELYWRIETFRSPAPRVPPLPPVLHGFACFTDDGEAVAYDVNGNVDNWKPWEQGRLNIEPKLPERSLESIEEEVKEKYYAGAERDEVSDLLVDRRKILNSTWVHSQENVAEIQRVNDRLNRAVSEALEMGRNIEKTLSGDWGIDVEIIPLWEDDAFQNILVDFGLSCGIRSSSPCFSYYVHNESDKKWDFKEATLDDGNSWDEGFDRPAYMDCYFLHPFHSLAYDNYLLALPDLLSIKDFEIKLLITKNAEK